jgi:hypothetical protein
MSNDAKHHIRASADKLPRSGQKLEVDSGMQLAVAGKWNQPDTPAPPNRVAASRYAPLGWWGVANTITLDEIDWKGSNK